MSESKVLELSIAFFITSYSFNTLFTEPNSLCLIYESNKSTVLIWCFVNNTVLSCFFLFFLIIDVVLFFLIVIVVVVNVFVDVATANDNADRSFDVAVVAGALSLLLVWIVLPWD